MCFARYTFIFLCRPVIIDTYTMIMDNSIIKFVRYDVIQLPGETIKEWYWHLILFVMHERPTLFFTKMNLYFFGLLGFWLLYRTGKSDLHCISLNIDAWLYIQKRKAFFLCALGIKKLNTHRIYLNVTCKKKLELTIRYFL